MWKTIGQNYDGPALRGVRFLLAALTVGSSLGLIARFKRHFIAVERVIQLLADKLRTQNRAVVVIMDCRLPETA